MNKFVVKDEQGTEPIQRNVSVEQGPDGVRFIVNGQIIARLDDNDNRMIFVSGISEVTTGLDVSIGGRVRYVWDEDKETSRCLR